jgi:hypothetical protein
MTRSASASSFGNAKVTLPADSSAKVAIVQRLACQFNGLQRDGRIRYDGGSFRFNGRLFGGFAMSRIRLSLTIAVLTGLWCRGVVAQTPVVEHHHHVYDPQGTLGFFYVTSTAYTDLPGSTKTVTVPAGKAVITWALPTVWASCAFVRPVIGTHTPDSPLLQHNANANGSAIAGSWATVIESGTFDVKLQAAISLSPPACSFVCTGDSGAEWTLIVFPTAAGGVPAVGSVGLALLVALLLGVGGAIIAHRRRASVS